MENGKQTKTDLLTPLRALLSSDLNVSGNLLYPVVYTLAKILTPIPRRIYQFRILTVRCKSRSENISFLCAN